jgi:hypothetical protein
MKYFVLILLTLMLASSTSFPSLIFTTTPQSNPVSHADPGSALRSGQPRGPCGSNASCPMGIADYGVGPNGTYSYSAKQVQAITRLKQLSTTQAMSLQLNGVVKIISEGIYWAQDVIQIIPTQIFPGLTSWIIVETDNVWNFSAPNANMTQSSSVFEGNKLGECSISGIESTTNSNGHTQMYWYCLSKISGLSPIYNPQSLVFVLHMGNNVGMNLSCKCIRFEYTIDNGSGRKVLAHLIFDQVDFLEANITFPVFVIKTGITPSGNLYDLENVFGGNCCGRNAQPQSINATMMMLYEAATYGGGFRDVPHAWSAGDDTAETVTNVEDSSVKNVQTAFLATGPDNLIELW